MLRALAQKGCTLARQENTALPDTLAEAQEQLYRRRLLCRQERLAERRPLCTDEHGRLPLPSGDSKKRPAVPPHISWESQPWSRVIHEGHVRRQQRSMREESCSLSWLPERKPIEESGAQHAAAASLSEIQAFTLYPDLAIAMMRQGLVAPGRIWLLLRHLDQDGRGWVSIAKARAALTGQKAPLRVCGWRQMRNLLSQGDGLFWQRSANGDQDGRIWLRSPAKVAKELGLRRFSRRPVTARLEILLDGIGAVRAHFFASFHSSRDTDKPIARQTLKALTGVSRRSQRIYEETAGVQQQQNWAVGEAYSKAAAERRAWQHGNAVFELHDIQGRAGAAGQSYVAWQMPNSYAGPHALQPTARKKRINRQLTDLFNKGKTGNGEKKVDPAPSEDAPPATRYFRHGSAAARAYTRYEENDLYWRAPASYRQYKIWHLLPAQIESRK